MHFLKTSLFSLLSLALAASAASVPSGSVSQNIKFWEDRITTFRKENDVPAAKNKILNNALEVIRNQDTDSYDSMKESLISAFGLEQAESLFVAGPSAGNKLETRIRECECSTIDGSDCQNGWVCVERDNDPNLHCEDSGPIGGCGWGGVHGCIGVCIPP